MHPLPPPPALKKPNQIVLSNHTRSQHLVNNNNSSNIRSREKPILPEPRRTNPIIWCGAILCMLFSLLLIFFGITTIVIFVAIKPKYPSFDTPQASLSVIYFVSPEFLNGDITFVANFSNPNRKLSVGFEHVLIELYVSESLIAAQVVQPFRQRPGEVRLIQVHLVSSLVYVPPNVALQLHKQEQRNRVVYYIKGTFRVKVKMGFIHYSYSMHANCQMVLTSPPNGVLVTHTCRTKR